MNPSSTIEYWISIISFYREKMKPFSSNTYPLLTHSKMITFWSELVRTYPHTQFVSSNWTYWMKFSIKNNDFAIWIFFIRNVCSLFFFASVKSLSFKTLNTKYNITVCFVNHSFLVFSILFSVFQTFSPLLNYQLYWFWLHRRYVERSVLERKTKLFNFLRNI